MSFEDLITNAEAITEDRIEADLRVHRIVQCQQHSMI